MCFPLQLNETHDQKRLCIHLSSQAFLVMCFVQLERVHTRLKMKMDEKRPEP